MVLEIKIGLAQIAPRLGDIDANLALHLQWIEEAAAQGVQLLIFPELSLTGYLLKDLVANVAISLTNRNDPYLKALVEASAIHNMDIVFGCVEEDRRHRFYVSAAYLHEGEIQHVHRKVYLPTYALFDEGRFFAAGDGFRSFDTMFGRAGILICEDFWHASAPYLLWADGADLSIHISASPGRGMRHGKALDSTKFVERVNQAYASLFTNYVVHCNRVGMEDGLNFWGGSAIYAPDGEEIASAPYFDEMLLQATLDLAQIRRVRQRLPLLRDEKWHLTRREMQRIQTTCI